MGLLHYADMVRLCQRAVQDGATRESVATLRWNIAGSCQDPQFVRLEGYPEAEGSAREIRVAPGTPHPLWMTMQVPCRKCDRCLRYRSMLWTMRAKAEIGMATLKIEP